MENPIVFMSLLLIIGFYDDIEKIVVRVVRNLITTGNYRQTLLKK